MKKIIFFIFILTNYNQIIGQNLIQNYSFESLVGHYTNFTCPDPQQNPANCNPFLYNLVNNWKNLKESPEIKYGEYFTGDYCAKLVANVNSLNQHTFVEGIFQNLTLSANKIYNFTIKYKSVNFGICNFTLSNNFIHNNPNNILGYQILPANTQYLGFTLPNSFDVNWQTVSFTIRPDINYSQIGFSSEFAGSSYPNSGSVFIDDIIITESCCVPNLVYDNITNPPSANVQGYIRCNSDVTFNNNSYTYFAAKNEILLQNNTLITDVASFVAIAEDCLAKPVELYTQIEQAKCKYKVFLSACYGSGQYEFYFGEELSENKVKDYSLVNAGSSITVKVKDLVSGLIVSKVITLPINDPTLNPNPTKYQGAFTFNIGNVFTPNGDGINDVFRVIDSSKTRFAYNAYAYKFWVWNRWGNNLLELEKEIPDDDINGFNDQEIFWNGRKWQNEGDMVTNGTYYYLLQFNNCTEAQIENDTIKGIRGTITLIKRNNFTEQTSIKEEINNNNFKSEIFPNPGNGSIKLKLFVNDNNNPFLKITDIMGKEQLVKYTLIENKNGVIVYEIDCSQLNNGIYFCTIFKNNTTETIKFSIVK
jgi:hypothetical protein